MTVDAPVLQRTFHRDVAAALEPLRRKQRDLQAFMASQLERLELQAGEVERREAELNEQTAELAKQRAALDEEWAHLDALVETAQTHAREILEEKQRLAGLIERQSDSSREAEIRRLQEALDHAVGEREALEEELSAAQRKVGQLADVAVELNEVRSELERLRQEASRSDAGTVEMLRQKLAEADREREQERRRYTEERTSWLTELRMLSRSLTGSRGETHEPSRSAAVPETEPKSSMAETPADAVLDRFEAMKRDLAKHRPPKK